MEDIKLLQDRVEALRRRVGQLKQTERIMLQAHGLETQLQKASQESPAIETDIQAIKEELADLSGQQEGIINRALNEFALRMQKCLPHGMPSIKINGDKVEIGWMIKNSVIPFKALSGGERVSFDIALANAFGADLIIKEVAELDQERLALVLERLKDIDAQVVVATCHTPSEIPKEWSVCAL